MPKVLSIWGLVILFYSCTTSGPGLFGKKSPHEQYADRITNAGLRETALGRLWFEAAEQSIRSPSNIQVPYNEVGYFSAEQPRAVGLRFRANRGEKLSISLNKKPLRGFLIYLDLLEEQAANDKKPKHLLSADTSTNSLSYEVRKTGTYLIRIQPELLMGGEYTISLSSGPSLTYPIKAPGTNHIKSFWGDARDEGTRKHEGIDLFAPFRTPVVAAAKGKITAVNENDLGGKVVWLRPEQKDYTLYYAHLDTQLVDDGQDVQVGDTLGLMGNTGNARFTSPHLHFGIYTFTGPVDPFHFVNPQIKNPGRISAPLENVGKYVRTTNRPAKLILDSGTLNLTLPIHTILRVESATSSLYKISLPDGQRGFINSSSVTSLSEPIRQYKLEKQKEIFDAADTLAPRKMILPQGETVRILAYFNNYYFVKWGANLDGWISK